MEDLLRQVEKVNSNIQFTIEEEMEGQLPFLDTTIMRTNEGPRFSIYCISKGRKQG